MENEVFHPIRVPLRNVRSRNGAKSIVSEMINFYSLEVHEHGILNNPSFEKDFPTVLVRFFASSPTAEEKKGTYWAPLYVDPFLDPIKSLDPVKKIIRREDILLLGDKSQGGLIGEKASAGGSIEKKVSEAGKVKKSNGIFDLLGLDDELTQNVILSREEAMDNEDYLEAVDDNIKFLKTKNQAYINMKKQVHKTQAKAQSLWDDAETYVLLFALVAFGECPNRYKSAADHFTKYKLFRGSDTNVSPHFLRGRFNGRFNDILNDKVKNVSDEICSFVHSLKAAFNKLKLVKSRGEFIRKVKWIEILQQTIDYDGFLKLLKKNNINLVLYFPGLFDAELYDLEGFKAANVVESRNKQKKTLELAKEDESLKKKLKGMEEKGVEHNGGNGGK